MSRTAKQLGTRPMSKPPVSWERAEERPAQDTPDRLWRGIWKQGNVQILYLRYTVWKEPLIGAHVAVKYMANVTAVVQEREVQCREWGMEWWGEEHGRCGMNGAGTEPQLRLFPLGLLDWGCQLNTSRTTDFLYFTALLLLQYNIYAMLSWKMKPSQWSQHWLTPQGKPNQQSLEVDLEIISGAVHSSHSITEWPGLEEI